MDTAFQNTTDRIILVDEQDREVGSEEKLTAHRTPLLHRAFSIFLYDDTGEEPRLLLQQRAYGKYHSGGLWANSCCSHPRVGEVLAEATVRRLQEELGVAGVALTEVGSFVYCHKFRDDLYEHEFDHVFVGRYAGPVKPNPEEIARVEWVPVSRLRKDLQSYEARRAQATGELQTAENAQELLHPQTDAPDTYSDPVFAAWFPTAASFVLNWLNQRGL
ncbi:MAG: isopentenyl-diphosphate Delta-isomerase [Mogibacterium sp.]|nr:isopentenyl-diphosphate Delta-isomerase [Mogibacterium sp.]